MTLRYYALDSLGERYTEDDFQQQDLTIAATPLFIGSLDEPEDRGDSGFVQETSLGSQRGGTSSGREEQPFGPPKIGGGIRFARNGDCINWSHRMPSDLGKFEYTTVSLNAAAA